MELILRVEPIRKWQEGGQAKRAHSIPNPQIRQRELDGGLIPYLAPPVKFRAAGRCVRCKIGAECIAMRMFWMGFGDAADLTRNGLRDTAKVAAVMGF